MPATRSVPPHVDADADADEGGSATAWTGEKRRKTTHLASSEDVAEAMDIQLQEVHGNRQEEGSGSVFSALDKTSFEEIDGICAVLRLRETTCRRGRIKAPQDWDVMHRRLKQLRLNEVMWFPFWIPTATRHFLSVAIAKDSNFHLLMCPFSFSYTDHTTVRPGYIIRRCCY